MCANVAAFEEAGRDAFYATLFAADTVDEMLDQMRLFSRYVRPAFRIRASCNSRFYSNPRGHSQRMPIKSRKEDQ